MPQAAVASWLALLNGWAALRLALAWLWKPSALRGSEMVASTDGFGAAWSSGLRSLAALCSFELSIQQRCWFTAHLTGGPSHQTRCLRVSIKVFKMVETL